MDDNGTDALVAVPRRSRGFRGGVAGGQMDEDQGARRPSGGVNLVDQIVGLQRRKAGTARSVKSTKSAKSTKTQDSDKPTSSTQPSFPAELGLRANLAEDMYRDHDSSTVPRPAQSSNARMLFDPAAGSSGGQDRQRRGGREDLAASQARPRSPAIRHSEVAAPRSPHHVHARANRTRRPIDNDFDDDNDFVRDDNKYLVRNGEEDDRRAKPRVDEYSREPLPRGQEQTAARHPTRREGRRTRFEDSDENSDFDEPRRHRASANDEKRSREQSRGTEAGSSKYAPLAVDQRTSSGEGLHSWGRRQQADESDDRRGQAPPANARYQGQGPMRMLFNPNVHDPVKFHQTPSVSTGTASNGTGITNGTSRHGFPHRGSSSVGTTVSMESRMEKGRTSRHASSNLMIPMILDEDDEEEQKRADRERERRKRKEGSEKGSQAKRRGEEDGKSKGSRSSEGSESLRDRERGRGNDTGIIPRLREAYKGIMAMENNLTELHRKMASDPSGGVRSLVQAGLLGRERFAGNANQVFDPTMRNGAAGFLANAHEEEDEYDEYSRHPVRKPTVGLEHVSAEEEDAGWVELLSRHKRFADAIHDFLSLSLDPLIPASLHSLPVKYNIPTRLWQTGFHLILEKMRYTWIANAPVASNKLNPLQQGPTLTPRNTKLSAQVLEHLTDFIYDAYTFYTNLLEEQTLGNFRSAWIEALGDLARYRMAVAAHVAVTEPPEVHAKPEMARIDDDDASPFPSGASIGAEVAQSWHIEERETWRTTSRDWYFMGLTEKPGEGRLHHHLALLCRDVKGEEGRALYHFMKSLTASHPYASSRESLLPLFDTALQRRRATFEATASDLFLLMHGMLFTKIELDNFDGVFDRFMERLTEDLHMGTVDSAGRPIPQVEWLTMAIVNMAAMMQYGIDDGMIRKALAEETAARKVQKAAQTLQPPHAIIVRDEDHQDDNDTNGVTGKIKNLVIDPTKVETYPLPFANACRLSFAMLRFCLQHPTRLVGLTHVLNPYITTMLTFLATVLKQPAALQLLEYYIPWVDLVAYFNIIPRKMDIRPDPQSKLMSGPPIPEDWCMRGMEWVGRRVYERGFWKIKSNSTGSGSRGSAGPAQPRTSPKIQNEMDVLTEQDVSPDDVMDGVVDDVEGTDVTDTPPAITQRRWRRSAWAAGVLIGCVPGIEMSSGGQLAITPSGTLQNKISAWEAARQRKAQEEMERLRREEEARGEWALADTSGLGLDVVDSGSEDEGDEPELADLRARRRHLRALLHQPVRAVPYTTKAKISNKVQKSLTLAFLPGYTVLVFDTNVLLSSLELVASLIECKMWTCIVPLPVVTELDGLAKETTALGQAASAAIKYLERHVRSHAVSLKIQTSKGNYLSDLFVRTEQIDFRDMGDLAQASSEDREIARAQTMDDFILRVAVSQSEHFVDRSRILSSSGFPLKLDAAFDDSKRTATKVLLLTFDRNLRLRARARGIEAADEKEMAKIFKRVNGPG